MASKARVAVIGAGWSGLYTVKALRQAAADACAEVDVRCFERSGVVGGLWRYDARETVGSMHASVHLSSSRTMAEASDFPMPRSVAPFPSHAEVLTYLESYADHFRLRDSIQFHTEVLRVAKPAGSSRWLVTLRRRSGAADGGGREQEPAYAESEVEEEFDFVVVASGGCGRPNDACVEEWKRDFKGTVLHSSQYRSPDAAYVRDRRVLLVGGGESATNIANDIARESARLTCISVRRGQWMIDRELSGAHPADILSARGMFALGYYGDGRIMRLMRWIHEYLFGFGGSSVDEWHPVEGNKPYMASTLNCCREVIREVIRGEVMPRRGVRAIDGARVYFDRVSDPTEFDTVIVCSGYLPDVPFLADRYPDGFRACDLYHMVFDAEDVTLAFVGMARPHYGPWSLLAELQARWVAAVVVGAVQLPPLAQRRASVEHELVERRHRLPGDYASKPGLVNTFEYADRVSAQMGMVPRLWAEYQRSPWESLFIASAQFSAHQYYLNDPKRRTDALRAMHDGLDRNSRLKMASMYLFATTFVLGHVFVAVAILFFLALVI